MNLLYSTHTSDMNNLKDGYIDPMNQKINGLKNTLKHVSNARKVGINNKTLSDIVLKLEFVNALGELQVSLD